MPSATSSEPTDYTPRHANVIPEEGKRLDGMYNGIREYLGGGLSFAPLEDTRPQTILEVGSGAGAWAIQAANQFPDAEVLAVDLLPIPSRTLPQNMKFQTLDVTKPCPFELETFDVVHARFLLFHLPRSQEFLRRVIQLVKPGGWLLLEDIENMLNDQDDLGPGIKSFCEAMRNETGTGEESLPASAFENNLKASNVFSEVNAKKVVISFSDTGDDTPGRKLNATFKTSFLQTFHILSQHKNKQGITAEVAEAAQDELRDPNRNMHMNLYFVWSRKRE